MVRSIRHGFSLTLDTPIPFKLATAVYAPTSAPPRPTRRRRARKGGR